MAPTKPPCMADIQKSKNPVVRQWLALWEVTGIPLETALIGMVTHLLENNERLLQFAKMPVSSERPIIVNRPEAESDTKIAPGSDSR